MRSLGAIILDDSVDDATLRPRLFAAVPRETLEAQVAGLDEWVAGKKSDAVYGNDVRFRRTLESHGQAYVLAVQCDQRLWVDLRQLRVDRIADGLPAKARPKASAGAGSKGPRWYDWAVQPFGSVDERGWRLWLLVRRSRERGDERAYHVCRGPAETPWRELVRVAGARWAVEECFERARGTAASTNSRCDPGPAGAATSRCRCSPWRC